MLDCFETFNKLNNNNNKNLPNQNLINKIKIIIKQEKKKNKTFDYRQLNKLERSRARLCTAVVYLTRDAVQPCQIWSANSRCHLLTNCVNMLCF